MILFATELTLSANLASRGTELSYSRTAHSTRSSQETVDSFDTLVRTVVVSSEAHDRREAFGEWEVAELEEGPAGQGDSHLTQDDVRDACHHRADCDTSIDAISADPRSCVYVDSLCHHPCL